MLFFFFLLQSATARCRPLAWIFLFLFCCRKKTRPGNANEEAKEAADAKSFFSLSSPGSLQFLRAWASRRRVLVWMSPPPLSGPIQPICRRRRRRRLLAVQV